MACSAILLSACINGSKDIYSTSTPSNTSEVLHLKTLESPHETPTLIQISPKIQNFETIQILPSRTASLESPQPMLGGQKLKPGIYAVFWKNGSMNIVFPSGATKELLRLYDSELYTNQSGGTTELIITSGDTLPSPDGHIITFMNLKDGFIYNFDQFTGEIKKIPQPGSGSNWGWSGDWSPDGRFLLYSIDHGTPEEFPSIFITELKNNSFARLTKIDTVETGPVWSPDFQGIAFASDRAKFDLPNGVFAGATDIYLIPTSCVTKLESCVHSFTKQVTNTGLKGDAGNPSWSPDGSKLAYTYIDGKTGDRDLYIIDSTNKLKNITQTPRDMEYAFSWSPDGKRIVFPRYSYNGDHDLFIQDIASGIATNITNSPSIERGFPFWSPDGNEIAFNSNVDDPETGVTIYSVSESSSKILPNSAGGNFLFWLTVFPEISNGTTLSVSPSGHDLNLRDKPSKDSAVIDKLESGDRITLLEKAVQVGQYSWWKIKSAKGEGWVLGNYNWFLPDEQLN